MVESNAQAVGATLTLVVALQVMIEMTAVVMEVVTVEKALIVAIAFKIVMVGAKVAVVLMTMLDVIVHLPVATVNESIGRSKQTHSLL